MRHGWRIGVRSAPATRKQDMQDKYVDIPPELMGKADPDDQWIEAQLERIDPSLIDYDTEYSVARATRALILELRDKLAAPKPDTGGPAFPSVYGTMDNGDGFTQNQGETGITVRDYFAAKAMQAALMTAKPAPGNGLDEIVTQAADAAYKAADAMLKTRGGAA